MKGLNVPLTARLLERLSVRERALLIGLWHATNELNALRKMILLANNVETSGPIEEAGRSLNSWLLMKLFALKACEAWAFFEQARNFPEFSDQYLSSINAGNLTQLVSWLDEYFNPPAKDSAEGRPVPPKQKSILKTVRNKSGAHYDYGLIMAASTDVTDLNSFLFITKQQGNSLYWAAEEVSVKAIQHAFTPPMDLKELVGQVMDDVHEVSAKLEDVSQIIGMIAIDKALGGSSHRPFQSTSIRSRASSAVDLPFFVDFSDAGTNGN